MIIAALIIILGVCASAVIRQFWLLTISDRIDQRLERIQRERAACMLRHPAGSALRK